VFLILVAQVVSYILNPQLDYMCIAYSEEHI
jgi:hypothetical protein